MPGPLRIGVLGAGKIAPISIIAPARERDDAIVTCVAARDPARAHSFARHHGIPSVAESYGELIARDDVDLVHVALPAAAHAEWSIRAVEAGKAVLCEKPFSCTVAEAYPMVEAAERYDRPLIEAFHYFHHPVLRRLMAILESRELGRLRTLYADFAVPIAYQPEEFRWRRELGGGALMDLGCYAVHVLRHAAGEPRIVSAAADIRHGVDASLTAELAFSDAVTGRISCSMVAATPSARLFIEAERGSLEILNYIVPQRGCSFRVTGDGISRDEPVAGPSTFAAQLQHLVDVCLHGARPLTGGADAIANMAAIQAIYRATGAFNQ